MGRKIRKDSQKIVFENTTSIDSFAYSPIFKNIAGDTRILQRAEFRHHVDENIKHDDFHTKFSREIVKESNLFC